MLDLIVLWNAANYFMQEDLIWFVDNQGACSMLVKGSATQSDLAWITTAFHVFMAALQARVYVEWVPSASNPADGLSRAGMDDL